MRIKELCWDSSLDFKIYEVDEVSSTNTYLKESYTYYEDKSVLIAQKQTQGRGRYNRLWISDNDICFSVLFKKRYMNAIIAPLSIVLSLKEFHISTGIKWPNDIYLNQKKLSGILIEDIYEGEFKASIVGIGINLKDKNEVNGIGLNIDISKECLISRILFYYHLLLEKSLENLIDLYKEYSLVLGKKIQHKNKIYMAKDITEKGFLVLENQEEYITISGDEIDILSAMISEEKYEN